MQLAILFLGQVIVLGAIAWIFRRFFFGNMGPVITCDHAIGTSWDGREDVVWSMSDLESERPPKLQERFDRCPDCGAKLESFWRGIDAVPARSFVTEASDSASESSCR